MVKPKLIIFDVNETLLSLDPLKASVGHALGGREDLLPLWFSTLLHYSLVETLTDSYHDFEEIGTAALMMVAEAQGIALTHGEAQAAIVKPMRSLPPHADVMEGLKALKSAGFRLVSLSNSSAAGTEAALCKACISDWFEERFSVEALKLYKPHPNTYLSVITQLGFKPEEAMMVAAHAWDLAGAENVGLQTAFIARPGKTLYSNFAEPDYVANDLIALAGKL